MTKSKLIAIWIVRIMLVIMLIDTTIALAQQPTAINIIWFIIAGAFNVINGLLDWWDYNCRLLK